MSRCIVSKQHKKMRSTLQFIFAQLYLCGSLVWRSLTPLSTDSHTFRAFIVNSFAFFFRLTDWRWCCSLGRSVETCRQAGQAEQRRGALTHGQGERERERRRRRRGRTCSANFTQVSLRFCFLRARETRSETNSETRDRKQTNKQQQRNKILSFHREIVFFFSRGAWGRHRLRCLDRTAKVCTRSPGSSTSRDWASMPGRLSKWSRLCPEAGGRERGMETEDGSPQVMSRFWR